jgi:hypothetical protein
MFHEKFGLKRLGQTLILKRCRGAEQFQRCREGKVQRCRGVELWRDYFETGVKK